VSCHHHAAGTHPDVFRLVPAEEAATVAIDQIREVQAALPYQPLVASPRVVLIPDATLLRLDGANALLKTLEEPPSHALFIVMAPQRERLLPTIVSRCQAVRCSPPSQEAVIEHLTARLGLPAERARALFVQAQGRIGPAIQAASEPGEEAAPYEDVGTPSTIADPVRLLDLAQGIGKDQEALRSLLAWLTLWLRDVLAWQLTGDPDRVLHPDRRTDLAWWADRLSTDDLLDLASGLHAVWTSVHRNLNPQLVAETALLHIAQRVNHPTPRYQEIA
jgi:DNA polymerase-3 subunit delta'